MVVTVADFSFCPFFRVMPDLHVILKQLQVFLSFLLFYGFSVHVPFNVESFCVS